MYTVKEKGDGSNLYKARFVAKGYSQVEGVDCTETFAPTANLTSVRAVMQLAAQHDLVLHQMDVKSAYLNAPIDCEIFMEQAEGFEVQSKKGEKLVYKLRKSLYGLKQSGRNWNSMLHTHLCVRACVRACVRTCVYVVHLYCSAQLSMFDMEKRYRNKIIIIIIIILMFTRYHGTCRKLQAGRVQSCVSPFIDHGCLPAGTVGDMRGEMN